MVTKTVQQNVDAQGKPTRAADSRPAWFIKDHLDIAIDNPDGVMPPAGLPQWGPAFSEAHAGNSVEFYTTGAAYFESVAAAISGAKTSVFIAGWQVNYDVRLAGNKTLFDCLQDAMKGGATVYVMPWLAPPGPIDTGYLMTMLAVLHLNAGTQGARAYCMPAAVQSDQGTLNVMFSHHQKQVVVDNKKAFVGGIDLAYGRRDDANFSLKAGDRKLNEFYSPCVPPIRKLNNVDIQNCVTAAELIAAGLTRGMLQSGTTFVTSPSEGKLAQALDVIGEVKDKAGELGGQAVEWWGNIKLFEDFIGQLQDAAMDGAQGASKWAWQQLAPSVRGRIEKIFETGAANAADVGALLVAWLSGADMQRLPPSLLRELDTAIQAVVYGLMAGLGDRIDAMPARYERLFKKVNAVPGSATERDATVQPRMPWQDIQCCVQGPSVFDLSQNFVRRWNGTAKSFEMSYARYRNNVWARKLLSSAGIRVPANPKAARIAVAHLPKRAAPGAGKNVVQVLRSAPLRLQRDEAAAIGPGAIAPTGAQNNCLKAMLKAIHSSQKFLYIEGQFFQTCHTPAGPSAAKWSGPLSALLNVWSLPKYGKFADMLEINGVPVDKVLDKIRWAKVDDVKKIAGGPEFMRDLYAIIGNWATIEAMRLLGKPQEALKNPIGKALVNRIERAINDGLPFHVYLVLPVHPEGTLNTVNIMSQMHHTMQSLVHGNHSLVNGVRRAILVGRYVKEQKISKALAKQTVANMRLDDLAIAVGDDWKNHLTLLNLRNWASIGGRAVTEQIYVHSKLLIADDRVAILGSANINDRSQLGDRDSELAVMVIDDTPHPVKLDGVHTERVGKSVQKLRRDLWEKLFGLTGGGRPATALASAAILDSPAAPATWKAIQERAELNAQRYERAFWFVPRSEAHPTVQPRKQPTPADDDPKAPPGSIWPTWRYQDYGNTELPGQLAYRMPFDELFWRAAEQSDVVSTWNVAEGKRGLAPESAPAGVEGFIVALPTGWLAHEDNDSRMNLTVLAANDQPGDADQAVASTTTVPKGEGQPA